MLAHQLPVILGGGFDPSVVFAEMPGAWLEPHQGLMWQENTAVTPTTSAGQTIGLMLGLDKQQQLGPELILNEADREFLPGYTWNLTGGTWTIANGSATNVNGVNYMYLSGVLQSGKTYSIEIDAVVTGPGSPFIRFGNGGTSKTIVSGVNTYIGTQSGTLFLLLYGAAGITTVINSISVREYLGNHAYQATAANRPTLQYTNGLPLVRCDSNDFMTVSLPNLGSGVFSSSGSVYFALPTGMSALHNQSIGTSYSAPIQSMDLYSAVIVPSRLSDQREAQLQTYFEKLAGLR